MNTIFLNTLGRCEHHDMPFSYRLSTGIVRFQKWMASIEGGHFLCAYFLLAQRKPSSFLLCLSPLWLFPICASLNLVYHVSRFCLFVCGLLPVPEAPNDQCMSQQTKLIWEVPCLNPMIVFWRYIKISLFSFHEVSCQWVCGQELYFLGSLKRIPNEWNPLHFRRHFKVEWSKEKF